MSSIETTLARNEAAAAADAWKQHKAHCAQCGGADRSRQRALLCMDGSDLKADHFRANAELKRNRELDKLPSPDQAPLF